MGDPQRLFPETHSVHLANRMIIHNVPEAAAGDHQQRICKLLHSP